ncbi:MULTISPECIES: DUF6881 domain-containing protein [Chromobacterium]|uniref:DUF6881 domain-containing protein n=1 Tax=Chromobacterium TaxID=535 RepID=UPI0013C2C9BF|nr:MULTISPECIES: hypothetical protein [Chromobacterium]MDH0344191.1 hypothetical protein [Chromobacterium haemolyticum]MDH0344193.1 hypothetical protein [Chromobacterium haemolyticum]
MKHLKTRWNHCHKEEPSIIYQEIDDSSYEIRKIEIMKDGQVIGYASEAGEFGESILADQQIPTIAEINQEDEFIAEEITRIEFENAWNSAVSKYHKKQ